MTEETSVGAERASADTDTAETFTEMAFQLAGKSADEAGRVGTVDRADDQIEAMFDERFRTASSPLHRAVWDTHVPVELFDLPATTPSADVEKVMEASLDVVRRRAADNTLFDESEKIRSETFDELGTTGLWGLLVDRDYGGSGATFNEFAPFLVRMAAIDPTIAGMASVHQCIGAVDPLTAFGSAEQKQRLLPPLAAGERLSAFALTEPGAGSDLTALRTTARLEGDHYVVDGEKLFITNLVAGRTLGLVCLIDDEPAVLIIELPEQEDESFHLTRYGLHALRNAYNHGIVFNGFKVPAGNRLVPAQGDGLTIAYHGLNKGRVALCANASGAMRIMLASMLPWVHFRETYGQPIATRELVQRRLGRLAGLIVAADALVNWTSKLLDDGYRGEMECIVAKVFGSEAEKTAAIDLMMRTHGGRSFVHGQIFGDYVHDFLAPSIYEGEGEMLAMALFKSLVKAHGTEHFEPMARAATDAGITKLNPTDPRMLWAIREPAIAYGSWLAKRRIRRIPPPELPNLPPNLAEHAKFAAKQLQRSALEIDGAMRKHQLGLADRQARIVELTQRVMDATVMLCTALYGGRHGDATVQLAADVMCDELSRSLTGNRPSDREFRKVAELGAAVADGAFLAADETHPAQVLMPY